MLRGSVHQMERKEILEKLKSTEAEIRSNLEAAQHKKNDILTTAQKQAQKLEEDAERRMKTKREKLLTEAKTDIEEKRHQTLQKAQTEAEAIQKKAQVTKAKELFLKRFKEYLDV